MDRVKEQAEAVLEGERSTDITSAETQQEVALNATAEIQQEFAVKASAETQVEFAVKDLAVDSDDYTVCLLYLPGRKFSTLTYI